MSNHVIVVVFITSTLWIFPIALKLHIRGFSATGSSLLASVYAADALITYNHATAVVSAVNRICVVNCSLC
jgi:hypothetical protein